MKILAIESSCDETAVAAIEKKGLQDVTVLAERTVSSIAKHQQTRGIIPEVAAREQLLAILPTLQSIAQQLTGTNQPLASLASSVDYLAVSTGPGLIGSLLVGVETVRTLGWLWQKPIIPVNHVLAHQYAHFVKQSVQDTLPLFPMLSWTASGGHTELYLLRSHQEIIKLGSTIDDAAGECFDKCARVIGGEYPGGPHIEKLARQWQPDKNENLPTLPRPLLKNDTLNLSFSGLKTAFVRLYQKLQTSSQLSSEEIPYYLAWELQHAISAVFIKKTQLALRLHPEIRSLGLAGGVAANSFLREQFQHNFPSLPFHLPPLAWCTDNAVMIGAYAAFHEEQQQGWQHITAFV